MPKYLVEDSSEAMTRAERFNDLPPEVKAFLEDLRPEEVATLREGINLVKTIKTMSKVLKWTIISIVAGMTTGMTLYKQIVEFVTFMRGGAH